MNAAGCQTKVGVFKSQGAAEDAVAELRLAGFKDSEIGLVHRSSKDIIEEWEGQETAAEAENEEAAAGGAVTGALAGLGVGTLLGAGVLAGVIPVIGPAIFAGTLGVLASNAASGAAVAGLVGALTGWGLSKEDATYYEEQVSAGRSIVTVTSEQSAQAQQIMTRHGAIARQRVDG